MSTFSGTVEITTLMNPKKRKPSKNRLVLTTSPVLWKNQYYTGLCPEPCLGIKKARRTL